MMSAPYVDHIGIIVDDLEESLLLFERLFGMKPVGIHELSEVNLRVGRLKAANLDIELIQYVGGAEFARKVMGSEKGINHLAFRIKDVSVGLESFKEQGVEVMDGFPRKGSGGEVAFFKKEATQSILLEICRPENKV